MMRGAPAGGSDGSRAPPERGVSRLLGLVRRPEPRDALPAGGEIPGAPPRPTVGLFGGIAGWFGVLTVLPGPVPPGTPIPPLLIEPVLPVPLGVAPGAGPVGLEAPPLAELPPDVLPPVPPDDPPDPCASARVEPAAMKASVNAMEVFMSAPFLNRFRFNGSVRAVFRSMEVSASRIRGG